MTETKLKRTDEYRIAQQFIVVWLDTNITEIENRLDELRRFTDSIFMFDTLDSCIDFVSNIQDQKVFLILSDAFAESILPLVEGKSQLDSVYIISKSRTLDRNSIKQWSKVRNIFDDDRCIVSQLQRSTRLCEENFISMNIIPESTIVNFDEIDSSFMYTQLLKEIFIDMRHESTAKQMFTDFLLQLDSNIRPSLDRIDEFNRAYERHSPIWWYTKEGFIYSSLNRALRQLEIDVLMKMAFFVRDLHKQIVLLHDESHYLSKLTVYRGQGMSLVDFEKLKKSQGGLLSFNSFLSTSTDESVSLLFADSSRSDPSSTGILFEIEIDPTVSSVPFAALDSVSYFTDSEQEILFSMHTIFRIGDMNEIDDRLWRIKLISTKDNDEHLKRLTDNMRQEIGGGSHHHRLGWLMIKLNEYEKAEMLYMNLLKTTSADDWSKRASYYNQLGIIHANQDHEAKALGFYKMSIEAYQKTPPDVCYDAILPLGNMGLVFKLNGNYEKALLTYKKVLELHGKLPVPMDKDQAITHSQIASVYRCTGDFTKSLFHHEQALEIQKKTLPVNHPSLGLTYNNLGVVYHCQGNCTMALKNLQIALEIYRKSLPPVHNRPAETYNNIGDIYHALGDHANAMSYYKKAVYIQENILPSMPSELANTYKNLGTVCTSKGEYSDALDYFEKAQKILVPIRPPLHVDFASIYNNVGVLYASKNDLKSALENYEKALEIYQKTVKNTHPDLAMVYKNIGQVYISKKEPNEALTYLEKVLEIELKTLSPNHMRLAGTYNNIGAAYQEKQDYITAKIYFSKALEIQLKSLPSKHPALATIYSNIGFLHSSSDDYSLALSYYQKALEIELETLPSIHIDIALSHKNIGIVHYKMKNYSNALLHFQRTLEIQEIVFSLADIVLAETCDNIASVYYNMKDYSNAYLFSQRALNIRQKSLLSPHPDLAINFYNMAKTLEGLERFQEAISYVQKAIDMNRLLFGDDHHEVKQNQEYLDKLCRTL